MRKFRTAVLLVHGFAGGVYDAEYLDHRLELISKYDVYTFTLPGHDGDTSKKITAASWIKKAESEVEFLINNGYKKIYVIGHSMGGVIATYLASKYKEIKKLVLVAPAFHFISYEGDKIKPLSALSKTPKLIEQYGIKLLTSRMTKLPANAITEFINLVKKYQKIPQKVTIPTLILQGTSDNVVPPTTPEYVYSNLSSKRKKIIYLKGITHDVFRESKKKEACDIIKSFLRKTSSVKKYQSEI